MARKIRKDITVKGLVKKLDIAPGSIKNANGRAARSDKTLESLQKDAAKTAKKPAVKSPASKTGTRAKTGATAKPKTIAKTIKAAAVTPDQKTASLRKVKSIPKATSRLSKKVSAAIKKTAKK